MSDFGHKETNETLVFISIVLVLIFFGVCKSCNSINHIERSIDKIEKQNR